MREGSLDLPFRRPVEWEDPTYSDDDAIDEETRRVFDICHGCRRCFNLCDSFPKLFDLIDESVTGELDSVDSKDFKEVVDACTLCDMCFLTKCPYVPPHEFDLDFPHLMLRYRVNQRKKGEKSFIEGELSKVDRNASLAKGSLSILANWASKEENTLTRSLLEKTVNIHRKAAIPKFSPKTFLRQVESFDYKPNEKAPAFGQKAVLFATCFGNYNNTRFLEAVYFLLNYNGIVVELLYPVCCGMPLLEQGNIEKVVHNALLISKELEPWVEKGYSIIAPIPSCALMMKSEWPLLTDNKVVKTVSEATRDISEYLLSISQSFGLCEVLVSPKETSLTLHSACHARAQNIGSKAAKLLRLTLGIKIDVVEKCSGHGGIWGMMKNNFERALKVGKSAFREIMKKESATILSECPLACDHIRQGVERLGSENQFSYFHPIEILAKAYGFSPK